MSFDMKRGPPLCPQTLRFSARRRLCDTRQRRLERGEALLESRDFIGLRAATGHFRADWFLRFMGLEDHAACRLGGRLLNYLARTDISRYRSVIERLGLRR